MDKEKQKSVTYFISVLVLAIAVFFVIFSILGVTPKSINPFANYLNLPSYSFGSDYGNQDDSSSEVYTRPERIVIDKIGVDTVIEQPNTRDVASLDQALTKGAVHYPGSGSIESGNMFIFGHSTGFSVVQNQAYKTFNGLNELVIGDTIDIEANGKTYLYKVTSVNLLDENSALVEFDDSGRTLTISTCNSFGAKQERWVVEAEFYTEA